MLIWQSLDTHLQDAIATEEDRQVAATLFGLRSLAQMTLWLQYLCQQECGAAIAQCGLAYLSVGATFVVRLTDGSLRVVKVYRQNQSLPTLQACAAIQQTLAQQGFPAPPLLMPPREIDGILVAIQAYRDPGERQDGLNPCLRSTMARHLAQLIEHTRSLQSIAPLDPWMSWLETDRGLWHPPHSVLFDFERTAAGAEWIDAIARRAKARVLQAQGTPVIGHSDWSLQNMAFHGNTLTSVYDWDSLRWGLESFFVGGAARCYAHDWRYGNPDRAISAEEARAFIREYEAARGQPFSPEEQRAIGAALVYTAAYGTRCTQAIASPYAPVMQTQLQQFVQAFLDESD